MLVFQYSNGYRLRFYVEPDKEGTSQLKGQWLLPNGKPNHQSLWIDRQEAPAILQHVLAWLQGEAQHSDVTIHLGDPAPGQTPPTT
jgi:hypothetical protein